MPSTGIGIYGPSDLLPRVLREMSAQLLPRLRLIPEFRCWLPRFPISSFIDRRGGRDCCMCGGSGGAGGGDGKKTSQTLILWESLSQGVPLIILLDLLGSKTGGGSSFVVVGQRRRGVGDHWQGRDRDRDRDRDGDGDEDEDRRELNVALIEEFLRRVEILEVKGQIRYGEVFRVEEFLDGSCSGFIKVLRTVQRVLDCLEATYPNLYELPNAGVAHRTKEDLFERFLDSESLYLEDLRDMKECVTAMLEERSIVQEYLGVPLERMISFQEHIIDRLISCASRSTDSVQWNRLFGLKENMYILGAGAYQSYCSQFYALVDVIDAAYITGNDDELSNERCLELSRQLTLPMDHILSLIETCSAALEITHPVDNPNTFQSLCTAYQNLLNLKGDLFEVMRNKRTAYARRYINKHSPNFNGGMTNINAGVGGWNEVLGEFVLDDCVRARFQSSCRDRRNSGRSESSLFPSSSSRDCDRRNGRDAEDGNDIPNNLPPPEEEDARTDVGAYVFAFLFEKTLLLGRPISSSWNTGVAASSRIPFFDDHMLDDMFRGESCCEYFTGTDTGGCGEWDLGPAIRSGVPFDVLCTVTLAEVVEVGWLDMEDSEDCTIRVTWKSNNIDSMPSTLLLTFHDRKQLEKWIRVLSHLAPSDTVSADISGCEECNGDCRLDEEGTNSITWLDELEFSRGRTGSKPRPWSLIARRKEALSSSLYLTLSDNKSDRSFFSALSSPRSGDYSRSVRDLQSSPPRSISSVLSTKSAALVAEPVKLSEAIQSLELALPVIDEDEDEDDQPPDLTGQVRRIGNYPAAHGGFSDVWKCNWISGIQCYKVAVKVLRGKLLDAEREDKMAKRLEHEIKVWKRLDHENVVPLHGTCSDFGRYLSLVCPWYENGSLYQYVRKNDDVLKLPERLHSPTSRLVLRICIRVQLFTEICQANILIDENGRARLCDFGLSTLVEDLVDSWYPSSMLGGAIRWSAPELYCASRFEHAEPSRPRVSVSSDVYSFGSITLEILSGKVPYYHLKHDGQVLIELSKKVKPERTPSPFLTNDLWDLIRECWNDNPGARPSTARVSSQIGVLRQRSLARHSI